MHNLLVILFASFIARISSIDINETRNECKTSMEKVSSTLSDLSHCFVSNSSPNRTCFNCFLKYKSFLNESTNIKQINSLSGKHCLDVISIVDKYQMVKTLIVNASLAWTNSNCNNCFTNESDNVYRPDFREFIDNHEILMSCLQSHANSSISLCDAADFQINNTSFNQTTGCTYCYEKYKKLLTIYKNLYEKYNTTICGDVENMFLCARRSVDKYFKCANYQPNFQNLWPVIVIFSMTLLFYSCSSVCHDKYQIEIVNQARVIPCYGPNFESNMSNSMFSFPSNQMNSLYFSNIPSSSNNNNNHNNTNPNFENEQLEDILSSLRMTDSTSPKKDNKHLSIQRTDS